MSIHRCRTVFFWLNAGGTLRAPTEAPHPLLERLRAPIEANAVARLANAVAE